MPPIVTDWLGANVVLTSGYMVIARTPLCATNSASISFLELKGFKQVLTVAAMMENVPIDHVIATKEIFIPSPPTDDDFIDHDSIVT